MITFASSLSLPQVNLNGTTREQLVGQQVDVLRALRAADEAMAEANPHGRDYQLRPAEYNAAASAWNERRLAIRAMIVEIESHALAIDRDA